MSDDPNGNATVKWEARVHTFALAIKTLLICVGLCGVIWIAYEKGLKSVEAAGLKVDLAGQSSNAIAELKAELERVKTELAKAKAPSNEAGYAGGYGGYSMYSVYSNPVYQVTPSSKGLEYGGYDYDYFNRSYDYDGAGGWDTFEVNPQATKRPTPSHQGMTPRKGP